MTQLARFYSDDCELLQMVELKCLKIRPDF